ncbi:MAG: Na+/H+ antiporter subunit E [Defluviitaleaceae bacterium]|nr:Na+/H+ antiporter subunit E [Defluviitaleaceae bacterium]
MGKHTIFVTLALTFTWIILMEQISWPNVAIGMFISMLCMHFMGKFLHFEEIRNVNFYQLATYPLWLIGRIYTDALFMIKMILTNSKWGITTHKLELENEALRNILADSITLTPGSVFLEREGEDITLLCIGDAMMHGYPTAEDGLKSIQKMLIKSQTPMKEA